MSWFQSANIASLAKTALKEAQKTIDKALDIREEDGQGAAATNNAEGGDAARNAGVSSAVSDMASEFFASWGVNSTSSSKKSNLALSNSNSSSNSNSNSVSPIKNRAISTPPKRSSNSLPVVDSSSSVPPHKAHHLDSNHVPVTLLAGSGSDLISSSEASNCVDLESSSKAVTSNSKVNKHTRSLSDTVFHADDNDDNDSSLKGLVQVLDDNDSCVVLEPVQDASKSKLNVALKSPSRQEPVQPHREEKSEETATLSESQSTNRSLLELDSSEAPRQEEESKAPVDIDNWPTSQNVASSNLELLQEIDLDGGGGTSNIEPLPNVNVMPIPLSNLNTVESSTLSDGWDWTVPSTDSSFLLGGEKQESSENPEVERKEIPDGDDNCTEPVDSKDLLGISEETLKLEQDEDKTAVETSVDLSSTSTSDPITISLPPPKLEQIQILSPSSRPTTPTEPEVVGSSPPSSARVSPNFEMVSSGVCCVVSSSGGGTLPESSRSSSIVVVSGRDSTPNSRSGAGSSGSSEGGHDHDIVDGEVPHSPAAVVSGGVGVGVGPGKRKTSKHRKGASSSSSSDIEVIPSDYSSSSTKHNPKSDKPLNLQDKECQTDLNCESQQHLSLYVDSQVQTDEAVQAEEAPQDMSKYLSNEVADLLLEKDQEVKQLRDEGEKLSKKQFELTQTIKKLRAKEKENEGVVKGLRSEIATKNLELEKLMKTFISKEGIEQSQNETISKLNQERRRLELKVEELTSELEDSRDNVDSMKATVENASIEILELKNVISSVQRESAEVDRLTKDKAELISRTDSLSKEVEHLRSVLKSSQSSHHQRESDLKSQISTLTQKVHQLDTRLADISSEVADATMPLSMEIEKLQGELKTQVSQSDRREQMMLSQISEMEVKLRSALEKEKMAKEEQLHYRSQHSTLELQIEELEARNRNLQEQLQQKEEIFGKKLEDKVGRCQKLEKTVERLTGEVERLSSENDTLSNELKAERQNLEVERRRLLNQNYVDPQNQQIRHPPPHHPPNHPHPHPHHQRSSSMSTTASSTGVGGFGGNRTSTIRNDNSPRSREHSPSEHSITSEEASYLDEVFDPGNGNRSMTPKSFFESFSSAGLIENLQSQLRLREGEVISFQEELGKNEKIRKQLNEEIANLTMQNQQLALDMEKLGEMEQKLEELDKNYNAVLQMYGEKVEEADELRMDLEDVKEMYKTQIEQLLKKT